MYDLDLCTCIQGNTSYVLTDSFVGIGIWKMDIHRYTLE